MNPKIALLLCPCVMALASCTSPQSPPQAGIQPPPIRQARPHRPMRT